MNWQKLTFSWETKLGAIGLVVLGAAQGFIGKDTTLVSLAIDGKFQLALAMAVILWFTKSVSAHGTQDAPIPPAVAAAQLAAVPLAVLAPSPLGALVPGSKHVYFSAAGDLNAVGDLFTAPDGTKYLKITATTYEIQ
jgi:hypothetical protein